MPPSAGWQPRGQKPAQKLSQAAGLTGLERKPPSILASPPGTPAPVHAINYTPSTGEVHQPGVLAPIDQLNYSLLPADMPIGQPQTPFQPTVTQQPGAVRGAGPLAGAGGGFSAGMGMGAGAGGLPGSSIGADVSTGSESMTGRYGKQPSTRNNVFTPGQPPISPHPYGVGPGPRSIASGPQSRPMQQRGSSTGNLQGWGHMGGGQEMGSGQTTGQDLNTPGLTISGGSSAGASGGVQGTPDTGATTSGGPAGRGRDNPQPSGTGDATPSGGGGTPSGDNTPAAVPSGWHVDGDPNDPNGVLYLVNGDGSQRIPYAVPGPPDTVTGKATTHYLSDADVKRMLGDTAAGKAPVKVDSFTTDADGTKHYVTEFRSASDPNTVIATVPRSPNAAEAAQDAKASGDTTPTALTKTETVDANGNPVWVFVDRNGKPVGDPIPRPLSSAEVTARTGGNQATVTAEQIRAQEAAAATLPYQDIVVNGQHWLVNMHDPTGPNGKIPFGDKDPTVGVFTVGNQLLKMNPDGNGATVVATAPKGFSTPTQMGGSWISVNLDDPSKHIDVYDDPTWLPEKQAGIDETKANTAKILSDIQTGKITAEQGKINLAVAAHDLLHPQVQVTSEGLIWPQGSKGTVDPNVSGLKQVPVQNVDTGPVDPEAQHVAQMINDFLGSPDASLNSDAANKLAASIGTPLPSGTATSTDAANAAQANAAKTAVPTTSQAGKDITGLDATSASQGKANTVNIGGKTIVTQGADASPGTALSGRGTQGGTVPTTQTNANAPTKSPGLGGTVPTSPVTPADTGAWPAPTDDYGQPADIMGPLKGWNPNPRTQQQQNDYAGLGSTLDVGLNQNNFGGGQESSQQSSTPVYPGVGSTLKVGLGSMQQGGQQGGMLSPSSAPTTTNPVTSTSYDQYAPWDSQPGSITGAGQAGGRGGGGIGGGGGAGAEEGGDDLPDLPDDEANPKGGPDFDDPSQLPPLAPPRTPGSFNSPGDPGAQGGRQIRGGWPPGAPLPPSIWPRMGPGDIGTGPGQSPEYPPDKQNAKLMMDPLYHFAMGLRGGAGHDMGSGQVPTPPPPAPGGAGAPPGGNADPKGWAPPVPPQAVAGIGHRFGQQMDQGEPQHSGVDLQAPEGSPTVSPVDGKVERVEHNPAGLGLTVVIRDAQGMEHRLGHLQSTVAYPGMVVAQGQNLAKVGSTGNTTGAHLHWGVKDPQGQPQDPTPALPSPMQNMPPVPGTQMMGPPGGTGGAAQAGGAPPPMGGGQDYQPTMAAGGPGDITAQLARVGGWAQASNPPPEGWDHGPPKVEDPIRQLPNTTPNPSWSDDPNAGRGSMPPGRILPPMPNADPRGPGRLGDPLNRGRPASYPGAGASSPDDQPFLLRLPSYNVRNTLKYAAPGLLGLEGGTEEEASARDYEYMPNIPKPDIDPMYAFGSGQDQSSMPALGSSAGANTQSPDYQAGYQAGIQASTSPGMPPVFVPGLSQPIPTASDQGGGDQQMGGGQEQPDDTGAGLLMQQHIQRILRDYERRDRAVAQGQHVEGPYDITQPADLWGLPRPNMGGGQEWDDPSVDPQYGQTQGNFGDPAQPLPPINYGGNMSRFPRQSPDTHDTQMGRSPYGPNAEAWYRPPPPQGGVHRVGGGQEAPQGPADWHGLGPGEDSEINRQGDTQQPWNTWWRGYHDLLKHYQEQIDRAHKGVTGAGADSFDGRGLTPQMGRGSTGIGWAPQYGTGQDSADSRWDLYEQKDVQGFMGAGGAGGMGAGDVSTPAGRAAVIAANPGVNVANFNNAVSQGASESQALAAGGITSSGSSGGQVNTVGADTQARVNQMAQQAQDQLQVGMSQVNASIAAENDHHNEVMAQLQQNAQFHQDDVALQQAINQETQRHDQATEQLQAQATQMQQTIEQMREANAVTLQQMQEGTQIYLQQGQQAFTDWQTTQQDRMQILSSALNNPWLQQLAGMVPAPGQDTSAVTGGNIQNLINQILQPFNTQTYGAQNAPSSMNLTGNPNADPTYVPGNMNWNSISDMLQKAAGSNYNDQAAKQMFMSMTAQGSGATPGNLTQAQLDQIVQAGSNGKIGSWAQLSGLNPSGATPASQAGGPTAAAQAAGTAGSQMTMGANQPAGGQPTLPQQQTGGLSPTSGQTPTWNQWQGWDPFQMAAYRTDIEAQGPGAWNAQQSNLEQQFAQAGGSPNITQMQAAGATPTQSIGQQMTANVFGQTTPQWQQNQQKQWSQAQAPQVQSNLQGIAA
jgi:murein DD-endopeptidase MepM/ murein hydrolase activator NlpD